MIRNVPSHDQLNEIALLLYYEAWEGILSAKQRMDEALANDDDLLDESNFERLTKGVLRELAADEAKLAQSLEIGLKAKIAKVSPYLILREPHKRYRRSPKDSEFSEFATLDASELVDAVHSLTDLRLSDNFCRLFNSIRNRRNVFQHMGMNETDLNVDKSMEAALLSYLELWPKSAWLKQWIKTKGSRWHAVYYDYKYTSDHGDVFIHWPSVRQHLKPKIFKKLFNVGKREMNFIHPYCFEEANVRYAGLEPEKNYCTAYIVAENSLHCIACDETFDADCVECLMCKKTSFAHETRSKSRCLRCYELLNASQVSGEKVMYLDEDPLLGT